MSQNSVPHPPRVAIPFATLKNTVKRGSDCRRIVRGNRTLQSWPREGRNQFEGCRVSITRVLNRSFDKPQSNADHDRGRKTGEHRVIERK